jgi:HlyD family secretion protein
MPAIFRRTWFWLIILGLFAAVGGGVYLQQQAKAAKEKAEAAKKLPAPTTPFAAIANGKVDVEGGIIPVAARRGGVVREVMVQEGETVTKGQILARQEDDEARLARDRAAAELAQAQAQIGSINVSIRTAKREYDRLAALASTNFIAKQKLDQANDAIAAANAQLQSQNAAIGTSRARLAEADYELEQRIIRAPADGRIVRRYANPGAGTSTLNVSTLFDLEPVAPRIVRAEIVESSIPVIAVDQEVEVVPEADETKVYVGRVLRRAEVFGARKLQTDDPSERTDERVVEVVVSAQGAPLLIGQRVLVKFMKPGQKAGIKRAPPVSSDNAKKG